MLTYAIGLLAQLFFSARILVQWVLSERRRQVVAPAAYWVFSLMGSVLLFVYGALRNDFSILLGQTLSYYIYIWNLKSQGHWVQIKPSVFRYALLLLPPIVATMLMGQADDFLHSLFRNEDIPLWLLLLGSVGQCIFSLRFVYQWYYSYRIGKSTLPLGFWVISLVGSSIIIIYALIRLDPILILGQSFGLFAYIRNIMLSRREKGTSV